MPTLVAITPTGVGRRHDFETTCLIGRHPECDIQVVDSQLSKRHAQLDADGGQLRVRDLGSTNGVFVNGQRIEAPVVLSQNDLLQIGGLSFLVDPDLDILATEGATAAILIDAAPGDATELAVPLSPPAIDQLADTVMAVLSGRQTAEDSTATLMSQVAHAIGYDAGALIAGRDESAEALYVKSDRSTVSIPRSILKVVMEDTKAVRIGDAVGDTYFNQGKSVVSEQVRSVLACPLLVGNFRVGAVYLTRNQPDAYTDEDVDILLRMAPLLAVAVALSKRLIQLSRRLDAIEAPDLVGNSDAIAALRGSIAKAAPATTPVLIRGETGTGKELVARRLHAESGRHDGPFVPVNCGAIPEHLFESELFGHERGAFSGADARKFGQLELASGGTLFLDEIGELPSHMQVKLLRALQEQTFYRLGGIKPVRTTFRMVAATNRDLEAAIKEGSFREDLYYRINVLTLEVPPLRDRLMDVDRLVRHFVEELNQKLGKSIKGVDAQALHTLTAYHWPGNVRELRNVVERLMVLTDAEVISLADLPHEILVLERTALDAGSADGSLPHRVAALEREMVEEALRAAKGKKVYAAKALGISRPTLDRKIKVYDIDIYETD